jgi:hypothetical protein
MAPRENYTKFADARVNPIEEVGITVEATMICAAGVELLFINGGDEKVA